VLVPRHVGHRLVHRDAAVEMARVGGLGHHRRLRQRAAEMVGKFPPAARCPWRSAPTCWKAAR
jgi:hypothetical protein